MSTPASVKGHPIHAMLIVFPVGVWIFAMVADLVHLAGWGGPVWEHVALYAIGAGLVGAGLAAVAGLIDYWSISDPLAGRVATWHLAINLIVVALFGLSFWLRLTNTLGAGPVVVSGIATVLLGISGWLGGELVYVHGMGVVANREKRRPSARRHAA
jgi:uncharacterized membrane protein